MEEVITDSLTSTKDRKKQTLDCVESQFNNKCKGNPKPSGKG